MSLPYLIRLEKRLEEKKISFLKKGKIVIYLISDKTKYAKSGKEMYYYSKMMILSKMGKKL